MRKGSLENAEAEALITVALAAAQRRDDVAIQKKTGMNAYRTLEGPRQRALGRPKPFTWRTEATGGQSSCRPRRR